MKALKTLEEKYFDKYDITFQFWGKGDNNVFIERDGIELVSFGGRETVEDALNDTLEYLERINKRK